MITAPTGRRAAFSTWKWIVIGAGGDAGTVGPLEPVAPLVGACAWAAGTAARLASNATSARWRAGRFTFRAYWAGIARATDDSVAVIASPDASSRTAISACQCSLTPNATELLIACRAMQG